MARLAVFQNRASENCQQDGCPRPPQTVGENALYYGAVAPSSTQQEHPGPESECERGLGSTLVSGAGGAYIGYQMSGGMATAGAALIGALGANAITQACKSMRLVETRNEVLNQNIHRENHQQQQQYQQFPQSQQCQPQRYQ
ncbi:hypothetical protein N7507_001597 [Penicillium longicatenatum]|nr:hypothetical protein N7507_001597 [Penicillium longicatenatum]